MKSQASHSRIYLDVKGQGLVSGLCGLRQGRQQALFGNDGSQPEVEKILNVCIEYVRQDDNRNGDAVFPQRDGFLDGRDRQPHNAPSDQGMRDVAGAVSVRIGLDDGHDAAAAAEAPLNLREIVGECGKIDACVGGVRQGTRTS
jgi:hypothetical protein